MATPAGPEQPPADAEKAGAATSAPGPGSAAASPAAPAKAAGGRVTLATPGPGSLTVPPLEPGGETAVITEEGTEVDEETAERARAAALLNGWRLREL